MKNTFTLLIAVGSFFNSFAYNQESRLSISFFSSRQVTIWVDGISGHNSNAVDGGYFRRVQPGYHSIKIFQQISGRYPDTRNAGFNNQKLIYQTRIFIRPNVQVDIMINRFGKALIDERAFSYGFENDWVDYYQQDWMQQSGYRSAMSQQTFDALQQTLRQEAFERTRLQLARQGVSQQYLTTKQVKMLLSLFSFEESKLDLAKFCYAQVTDPHQYFQVYDAFVFSSSKTALSEYLQKH